MTPFFKCLGALALLGLSSIAQAFDLQQLIDVTLFHWLPQPL